MRSTHFYKDRTKVIIKVEGMTGHDLYYKLDAFRINGEKYTQQAVVVTIHTNIEEAEVIKLAESLKAIASEPTVSDDDT